MSIALNPSPVTEKDADRNAGSMPTGTSTVAGRLVHCLRNSLSVQSHFQLLLWLQSEVGELVAHDALLVIHGNFAQQRLQHSIISALPGMRTEALAYNSVHALRDGIFERWRINGGRVSAAEFPQGCAADRPEGTLHSALAQMHHALFHSLHDPDKGSDHLYVLLRSDGRFNDEERQHMALLLPHLDAALRRIGRGSGVDEPTQSLMRKLADAGLSVREMEVLDWVRNGKTNIEIGLILDISANTVKNHLQRIFRKLNVSNRAQAVGMLEQIGGGGRSQLVTQ